MGARSRTEDRLEGRKLRHAERRRSGRARRPRRRERRRQYQYRLGGEEQSATRTVLPAFDRPGLGRAAAQGFRRAAQDARECDRMHEARRHDRQDSREVVRHQARARLRRRDGVPRLRRARHGELRSDRAHTEVRLNEPILHVRALRKTFGTTEVLRGIDLKVAPQELVFIIGPSGSGKSTLLRCCNRLEEPTSGAITFDDVDLMARGTDINAMRRRIGMVFQSFNLYPHMTALGNVTLALRKVVGKSRAEADTLGMAALDRVGLAAKAKSWPNELSGGQQQRVAIARALALEPRILLFDEPTSALDPELVGSVLKVMRELRESGMTMVVVSHEMEFARAAADRVVFMDGGLILEQGRPEKIFSRPDHARVGEFVARISSHH